LISVGTSVGGWQALIFSVAHDLLWRVQNLGDCVQEASIVSTIDDICNYLYKWYSNGDHEIFRGSSLIRVLHKYPSINLSDTFQPVADILDVDLQAGQILFVGEDESKTLPNPLHVLIYTDALSDKRFSVPVGPVHGDLHVRNIVLSRNEPLSPIFIDFALFNERGSVLHDLAFLETSIALESVDLQLPEEKRKWEMFYQCEWFAHRPEKLPTELIGLRAQVERIRQVVIALAKGDPGIEEEYKNGYIYAIASAALCWVRFSDVTIDKRLGSLYIAARALETLRQCGFVKSHPNISEIQWRPIAPAASLDTQKRLEEGRTWFRTYGRHALQEGHCALIIGPALIYTMTGCDENKLAQLADLNINKLGLNKYDPAWANQLNANSQDDIKRDKITKYLKSNRAKDEFIESLASIPWIAIFDWSQIPYLYERFVKIFLGRKRIYRIFSSDPPSEKDQLGPLRMPWIPIRGAPDPGNYMVWGDDWINQLQIWKRRFTKWASQLPFPAVVIGLGLDEPMKEDIWGMVCDIFGYEAKFINISHPVQCGHPSQRAVLRSLTDLDLTCEQWCNLIREFISLPPIPVDNKDITRTIIYCLPESRRIDSEKDELRQLILEQDEVVRTSEHFEMLTEGTGRGSPPENCSLGDLFRGYPVLWQEIRECYPITRTCEKEILKGILEELKIGNPRDLHLFHEPGSGGSILVRQIAWKLYHDEHIPVMILHHFTVDAVGECLRAFWYKIDRSFVVIVEEEICSSADWEPTQTLLQQSQIPVVVLFVSTNSPEWIQKHISLSKEGRETTSSKRYYILDRLDDMELQALHDQLELLLGPAVTPQLHKIESSSLFCNLFGVFEGKYSEHRQIVHGLVYDIHQNIANLLKTLAFFRLYGDTAWVPTELLSRLAKVDMDFAQADPLSNLRDRIVLRRGSGSGSTWAINHPIIAEDILAELLTETSYGE
jgi:hypothetical protein